MLKQQAVKHWALIMIIFLLFPASVSAHTHLKQSVPVANAQLMQSPPEIRIQYSEEFDADLSKITLLDEAGTSVEGQLRAADDRWLVYAIPPLDPGVYTVNWQILSVDTHVTEGSFTFSVDKPLEVTNPGKTVSANDASTTPSGTDAAQPGPASSGIPQADPGANGHAHSDAHEHHLAGNGDEGDWRVPVFHVLRILEVLASIAIAGFIIFRYGIWGSGQAVPPTLFSIHNERALYRTSFGILLLSGALHLGLLTDQLSGAGEISFAALLLQISTSTLVGIAAWLRPVAVIVLILAAKGNRTAGRGELLLKLTAVLIIIVLFPLTGHAYGAASGAGYAVLSHVLHIVAAAIWVGGLTGVLAAIHSRKRSGITLEQLNRLIMRFSALALPSVAAVAISGILLAYMKLSSWNALLHNAYGQLILGKSAILLFLAVIGVFHRLVLMPRMKTAASGSTDETSAAIPQRFVTLIRMEIVLAVIALLLAGVLSTTSPPEKAVSAAPVYWHVMGDTAHMSLRISFDELSGQKLQLDVWLPTGKGAPTAVEVEAVSGNSAAAEPVAIPFKLESGGPDPYGFEGFDKYTYRAEGLDFGVDGDWKVNITATDSDGTVHRYEKNIEL